MEPQNFMATRIVATTCGRRAGIGVRARCNSAVICGFYIEGGERRRIILTRPRRVKPNYRRRRRAQELSERLRVSLQFFSLLGG